MMRAAYCLPIIQHTKAEVLATIHEHESEYGYFEVWLDYVDGADEHFIGQLTDLLGERLIMLFRRQLLEPITMPLEQRFKLLETLHESVALLDLNVTTQVEELDYIREHNLQIKLIASHHDYQATPDTVRLEEIVATMDRYKPSIYKLATMCQSSDDAVRLLQQLIKLKTTKESVIVLGMGEFGLVTRVFGSLWGNAIIFTPLSAAEQSDPGQLTKHQLEAIFKELGQ